MGTCCATQTKYNGLTPMDHKQPTPAPDQEQLDDNPFNDTKEGGMDDCHNHLHGHGEPVDHGASEGAVSPKGSELGIESFFCNSIASFRVSNSFDIQVMKQTRLGLP